MSTADRIYLDNAATSWPKPDTVYAAVDDYQRRLGSPAGRSAYAEAGEVSQHIAAARRAIARLLAVDDPRRIIFTANGTDSLNLAVHGLLGPGDHVVTSVVEHNSVLRPLRRLEETGSVEVTRVACDSMGVVDPDDVRRALRPGTRLVILSHASNVTGAIQPIAEIGAIARDHGALFLLDAAQTLGHVAWKVAQQAVDLVAAPGHKGLLGPLGTGILYVAPGMEKRLAPVRQGGTGSESESDLQPDSLPDKYESGNLNVPGILGLGAAAVWLLEKGLANVQSHAVALTQRLLAGLLDVRGVTVHGPRSASERVGVVSMTVDGFDPQEVAAMLDAACRIQTRSGLHCAPLMHRALGTLATGGTVRFSIGPFNTEAHIDAAVAAVGELASAGLGKAFSPLPAYPRGEGRG